MNNSPYTEANHWHRPACQMHWYRWIHGRIQTFSQEGGGSRPTDKKNLTFFCVYVFFFFKFCPLHINNCLFQDNLNFTRMGVQVFPRGWECLTELVIFHGGLDPCPTPLPSGSAHGISTPSWDIQGRELASFRRYINEGDETKLWTMLEGPTCRWARELTWRMFSVGFMWHSTIPTISDEQIEPLIHFKHTSIDGFIGINARPAIIPNEVICSNVLEMAEHGVIKLFMEPERRQCSCHAIDLHIWAATWDFKQCGMCDQQSLRSACAYAQSDQSLC